MRKTMVRRLAACLLAVLMLVPLTACKNSGSVVQNSDVPSVSANEAGLEELTDSISVLPVGTMGVTIQASLLAFQTMNWCRDTVMTADEITAAMQAHKDSLSEEELAVFAEQLSLVSAFCTNLYDEEARESVLMNIGIENDDFGWDDTTYEKATALTAY